MKQMSIQNVFQCVLLTTALLRKSYGLGECSSIQAVGSAFSVSGLSCVNYTAEFSWRVYSCLADTQLQLSCHNGTHNYTPAIPQTIARYRSESYLIPLEGTVLCELGGCYEDKEKYDEWLIPVTSFSCLPPAMPSSTPPTTCEPTTYPPSGSCDSCCVECEECTCPTCAPPPTCPTCAPPPTCPTCAPCTTAEICSRQRRVPGNVRNVHAFNCNVIVWDTPEDEHCCHQNLTYKIRIYSGRTYASSTPSQRRVLRSSSTWVTFSARDLPRRRPLRAIVKARSSEGVHSADWSVPVVVTELSDCPPR